MNRTHDAKNALVFAQNSLSEIMTDEGASKGTKSAAYQEAQKASNHVRSAQEILKSLGNRTQIQKINPQKCNLKELIDSYVLSVSSELARITAQISLSVDPCIYISVDKHQFKRVFDNLFNNSIHFLELKQGKRRIEIKASKVGNSIEIRFRDSGVGIAPHEKDKIFDIFFTTKGKKGLGFGLAIVKRILDEHSATITVDSDWGDYTEFKMLFNEIE